MSTLGHTTVYRPKHAIVSVSKMTKASSGNTALMQKALNETLSMLGEQSREAVLLYLEKYHNISVDGPNSFTMQKLESAFDTLFGSGQYVMMRRFNEELRKKNRHGNNSSKSARNPHPRRAHASSPRTA